MIPIPKLNFKNEEELKDYLRSCMPYVTRVQVIGASSKRSWLDWFWNGGNRE